VEYQDITRRGRNHGDAIRQPDGLTFESDATEGAREQCDLSDPRGLLTALVNSPHRHREADAASDQPSLQ
jgi:hypothetical protein